MGEDKMSSGSSWGKKVLQQERDKRDNTCQDCGKVGTDELLLEFHHTQPTDVMGIGRGLNRRARDIREHPDSYKLLCPKCHKEAHRIEAANNH